jgi:membrane dipeptidase
MMKETKLLSRRDTLHILGMASGAFLSAPMINFGRYKLFSRSEDKYSARAIELMEKSLVIDMTAFLTMNLEKEKEWFSNPDSYPEEEWEKVKTSGLNVLNVHGGPGLEYVSALNNFIANHDRFFMRIDSVVDLNRVKQSGRVGIVIGLQQGVQFQSVEDVDSFYGLGLRVSQLTYNHRTLLANGCMERSDGGLSFLGVRVVERMNEVGMAVDSAHAGDRTAMDTFEVSKKPVLITHSNCRALVPGHPRCFPDEVIRKMAGTGGVMGITFLRNFVRDKEPTTIEHLVDHFDHVAKLVGVEHVGIGADQDIDGHDKLPPKMLAQMIAQFDPRYRFRDRCNIDGVDHPKRTYDLAEALIRRGYNNTDIEGILGGNFKRVLSEIWSA